jgi:hypothetical protein
MTIGMKHLFTLDSKRHGRGPVCQAWHPRGTLLATSGANLVVHILDRYAPMRSLSEGGAVSLALHWLSFNFFFFSFCLGLVGFGRPTHSRYCRRVCITSLGIVWHPSFRVFGRALSAMRLLWFRGRLFGIGFRHDNLIFYSRHWALGSSRLAFLFFSRVWLCAWF